MPEAAQAIPLFLTPSWQHLGIWVAAFLTLAVYSFLYADSPLFKLAEHVFVGISAAYGMVILYNQAVLEKLVYPLYPALAPEQLRPEHPDYWVIIPALLGLMIFGRFFRGYQWTARWPLAFVVGFGAGVSIPLTFQALVLEQLHGTIEPFVPKDVPLAPADWIGALVLVVGVVCTLSYFYFSAPHRGWLGRSSRLGIWFLMIAFGAGFGNTVMARVSLLIGRVQFLLYQWVPLWWHPGQ